MLILLSVFRLQQFWSGCLEQICEQRGEWHYGHELIESAEAKAEGPFVFTSPAASSIFL